MRAECAQGSAELPPSRAAQQLSKPPPRESGQQERPRHAERPAARAAPGAAVAAPVRAGAARVFASLRQLVKVLQLQFPHQTVRVSGSFRFTSLAWMRGERGEEATVAGWTARAQARGLCERVL